MAPTTQRPPIQFRDAALEAELDRRSSNHNFAARRDLARYYELLKRERDALRLLEEEELLIAEACRDMEFTFDTAPYIRTVVHEAMEESNLAEKWHVNPDRLNAKLKNLTPGQAMALVDWIERSHHVPERAERELTDKEWAAISGGSWQGVRTVPKEVSPEISPIA